MEREVVIKVDHVSMRFNLASEKFNSFKEYVVRSFKKKISFTEFETDSIFWTESVIQ